MPLLAGLLVNLFTGLVVWFGQYVTRKIAFGLAAVAAMTLITGAVYIVMRLTLVDLAGQMTGAPAMFMHGLQMVIPPVAPACFATYMTMWAACTVYTWQKDLLLTFARAG